MTLQPTAAALPHLGFWQRPLVQKALPLMTSLALHAGIVAVGLATYQAVKPLLLRSVDQPFIPTMFDVDPPDLPKTPHWTEPRLPDVEWVKELPGDCTILKPSGTLRSIATPGTIDGPGETSLIIGAASSSGEFHRIGGFSNGNSDAEFGAVRSIAGTGTIFPPPSGPAARSVAFVCDASGSMTATFDPLKHEIKRFVDALRPTQAFNVIFFQESAAASVDSHSLLMAKPDSKRRAYTFLDGVSPRGQTDPLPALDLAFKQKPGLIYLLTDGDFPDNAAVLKFIRAKNTDCRTRINTIAFVARGDGYEKVLKTIARENGGVFRYVSEDDLGK